MESDEKGRPKVGARHARETRCFSFSGFVYSRGMASKPSRTDTVGKISLEKENGMWVVTIPFPLTGVKRYEFFNYEVALSTVRKVLSYYV